MPAPSKAKGPGGRPKKAPKELRNLIGKCSLTQPEKDLLTTCCRTANLTEAEYIRRRILGVQVVPPRSVADARMLSEVNSIGVSLETMHRDFRFDRGRHTVEDMDNLITQIRDVMEKVAAAYCD